MNGLKRGWGMHLNKVQYEVDNSDRLITVIMFSDNTRQKETKDNIILAEKNKVCNLHIKHHF